VVVGAGGAGGGGINSPFTVTPGGISSFGSDPALVAIGGGAGATSGRSPATSGGSGGGGGLPLGNPMGVDLTAVPGGPGTPGQGG
jgi:hypothetical protein